jgi:hypothetical protein
MPQARFGRRAARHFHTTKAIMCMAMWFANFDNIQTVPKANIGAPITHLSISKMKAAASAIGFALGIIDS